VLTIRAGEISNDDDSIGKEDLGLGCSIRLYNPDGGEGIVRDSAIHFYGEDIDFVIGIASIAKIVEVAMMLEPRKFKWQEGTVKARRNLRRIARNLKKFQEEDSSDA
jgi:hypothetical protein